MAGASPLVDDLGLVKRLEDAGSAAIVMHSLFEEQITHHAQGVEYHMDRYGESFGEALSYFPDWKKFDLGPDTYLSQVQKIKAAVDVPVIASLNGAETGTWFQYAAMIEEAGADALELNLYYLATNPEVSAAELEARSLEAVRHVLTRVAIPVSVKLSPFYSSLPHFVKQIEEAGAAGVVLFNRFYQPDIDIEELELKSHLQLSDSSELLLRLRWLAILCGRTQLSLGLSGGVHTVEDLVKSIMVGADAVQMVSAVLARGPEYLKVIRRELQEWLSEHEYVDLDEMKGSMSHRRASNPDALERANYLKLLQSWSRESVTW